MKSAGGEPVDRGRRNFLTAEFLRRPAVRPDGPLGPPPPALPSGDRGPCSGCAAPCLASCEPKIIRLHPSSHPLAGTPYLSFEKSGCTFCGDCVPVCPAAGPGATGAARLGLAILDQAACIAWDGVICVSCQVICSDGAIRMDGLRRPAVDGDACTGCGACVRVCPTRAIRISFPGGSA